MSWEVVGTVLASLGGASAIIAAFAHFLGKIWTTRIIKQTAAKYDQELQTLKNKGVLALEEFKSKSQVELKAVEHFGGISSEVYQDFFKKRVELYVKLLNFKSEFITGLNEEHIEEEEENFGDVYHSLYTKLRSLIIENQVYVSNELDQKFSELRNEAAKHLREADLVDAQAALHDIDGLEAHESKKPIYGQLFQETNELMIQLLAQVDDDVSKLRARIDIDNT